MNLRHINRKQRLGISNPSDFYGWALMLDNEPVERSFRISRLIHSVMNSSDAGGGWGWFVIPSNYMERSVHPQFDDLITELGLNFQHCDIENTSFTRAIQSIHSEACKLELYFNIIDFRPISELGNDLSDIELLDKLVAECGCNQLGEYWIEYSAEDGLQTLKALFERELVPGPSIRVYEDNTLADQFMAYFDDTVRFYGNSGYAPWAEGWRQKTWINSKNFQNIYETDFGLVLRDNKHIGFLLLARDNY